VVDDARVADKVANAAPQAIRRLYDQGLLREIKSAGEWEKLLRGVRKEAGLEVHHLIEKRFAERLEINAADIPSIVLTKEEHRVFTSRWRQAIGYDNMRSPLTTLCQS
jgi:hypothetical protein